MDRECALDRFLAGVERRRFMADGAERWLSISDTDRVAAHARFNTWRTLPPAERERWTRIRELTPEQIDRRPYPPC